MTDSRTSSAQLKRAEQLKRWEESNTIVESPKTKEESRLQFSSGIVFLASCSSGDKDEIQSLLAKGADINTANVDGLTALHQACIDDNMEMVEFLVENGADVNRGDNEGWTSLHATASCGFISIARYLLENGADVAAVNYDRELPIDIAESDEMVQLLQQVIDEKGIDCDKSRSVEVDKLLRDARNWAANGYVEMRDPKTGGTPLHVAAAKGYIDVALTLLEQCKVEPDCVDYEGWTPLHAAALWGQKEVAALLLKHGADPTLKNYSGQTCLDLVDSSISSWLGDAALKAVRRVNNNNKRKRSLPQTDVKRVVGQTDVINDKPPTALEIIPKISDKPPKGRVPSPETTEPAENNAEEELPYWRRSSSLRSRPRNNNNTRENKNDNNNLDNDTVLRRTHSFENEKTFYLRCRNVTQREKTSSCPPIPPATEPAVAAVAKKTTKNNTTENTNEDDPTSFHHRYRHVTHREKASSCPSIPPATVPAVGAVARKTTKINTTENTNEDVPTSSSDRQEREENTWNVPSSSTSTISPTNAALQTRSSSESVESNSSNSTPSSTTPTKLSPGNIFKNFFKSFVPPVRDEESETQRKAHAKRVRETRRSTQGVTLDEVKSAEQLVKKKSANGAAEPMPSTSFKKEDSPVPTNTDNAFEVEYAGRTRSTRRSAPAAETTVTLPLRRAHSYNAKATTATTNATTINKPTPKEDTHAGEEEKERESKTESKSSSSPASTQAALNVIQRRRRPKRRSTGVGHVDIDDIVNDRGAGGEGDGDIENLPSGGERTDDGEERDYKALYEASQSEVRRLRALLTTSEQQLRATRATVSKLSQENQNSLSENEKREKRAMERKLSEMEEELKQLQKLKAENERLRAENRALTRVVSKLTNSAAK